MFRASHAAGSHRAGRAIMALIAAAAVGLPAAGAAAADRGGGWYRRGGDHHGHRDHGHRGHSHHSSHHHHHGRHHHSGVSVRIGLPPIVIGSPAPRVVYRERRVVVHEPAPVVVQPSPPVIYQPAPVVVQQPAPVVVQQPAPVVVQQPAQPVVVTAEQRPIEPVVVPAPVPDTIPKELSMQAFRSGGTIMVHISGVNTGGTYTTTLSTGDLGLASPSVVLRNIQTSAVAGAPDTAFNVSLALNITRPVTSITVRFADQAHQVPIVDVPTSTAGQP